MKKVMRVSRRIVGIVLLVLLLAAVGKENYKGLILCASYTTSDFSDSERGWRTRYQQYRTDRDYSGYYR